MKRVLALLLMLLMVLCACGQEAPAITQPETTCPVPSTEPEETVRPDFGLYQPGSAVEVQTSGAVKCFPLEAADYYAVEPMGDGLLLFSGEDTTTLTLLREEVDPVEVMLNCFVYPDGCTFRFCENGLRYFDNFSNEIVFLNSILQEVSRTPMPEDFVASPALSADGKCVYYFSSTALRCFELNTEISRLLRDSSFATQEVWGIHFDDTVLECFVLDGGNNQSQFVSAQTGELLWVDDTYPDMDTEGNFYFAQIDVGIEPMKVFGTRGEKAMCLQLPDYSVDLTPIMNMKGVVCRDPALQVLSFYDLEQGTCSSQVTLDEDFGPWYVAGDENNGYVWILADYSGATQQALFCWDLKCSSTGDETICVTPYYTAEEPDTAGLSEIAKQAKALGEKYGVRIRVWEDAGKIQPDDYTYELEHLVPVYEKYLPALENTLRAFPDGFLKKLGKSSANGVLTISLVRQLYGNNDLGSLTTAVGIHFWNDGSGYIAVTMSDVEVDQGLFHEIFHAIDSYVLAESVAYDNWPDLNPPEFIYDYSYVDNQFREDYQYLEDETRAFIDMYSMSYPKEDRARIFEYAMMEGNESYFQSDIMQLKLKTLCKGIREAFKLKKYTEPLLWEQYLK